MDIFCILDPDPHKTGNRCRSATLLACLRVPVTRKLFDLTISRTSTTSVVEPVRFLAGSGYFFHRLRLQIQ